MKNLYIAIGLLISGSAFGQIEQNVNKTTGTESNPITEIDSIRFNAGQTEMEIIFNNGSMESHAIADIDNVTFSGDPLGAIASLDCAGVSVIGDLIEGTPVNAVIAQINYTGGNGGPHNGQTVTSTGVTGLTATLAAGNFANGAGTLTYEISGTPDADGTASFAIEIGGETCTLVVTVDAQPFTCGDNVTFTYNGSSVTYGTVSGQNGTCWLDRNLGASQVATSSTDTDSYGDYFQWGRGDDGHQVETSSTTSTLSITDQPGHGDFITSSSGANWDWRSPQNDNLWQGGNGLNNPCPSGFRLPTETELDTERTSWISNDAIGAFDSPLKLPMPGIRSANSSAINFPGGQAGYWSGEVSGINSISLNFNIGTANISIGGSRAAGLSVRCIKD
jgi:hypothetical protein